DRLDRSLQDLVGFLSELHALRIDLFLHQQGLDTTTPGSKAMFQMLGVFAEFGIGLQTVRLSCVRPLCVQAAQVNSIRVASALGGESGHCCCAAVMRAFDPMYGPAVRCKRVPRLWLMRSCINVSGF